MIYILTLNMRTKITLTFSLTFALHSVTSITHTHTHMIYQLTNALTVNALPICILQSGSDLINTTDTCNPHKCVCDISSQSDVANGQMCH